MNAISKPLGAITAVAAVLALGAYRDADAAAAMTPTVTQFLNAANCEYLLDAIPDGMVAFEVAGVPLTYQDPLDGVAAQVWVTPQQQIIIAYQGTSGGQNALHEPVTVVAQGLTDSRIFIDDKPKPVAFTDALHFAERVLRDAQQQGYTVGDVFVTGHSLGAIEAEYVAQQTGLGGIGFEASGIETPSTAAGDGSNFVNTATYGDPIAGHASDLPGAQPYAPPYVPGGGIAPHYGPIVMLGDPANEAALTRGVAKWGGGATGDQVEAWTHIIALVARYHLPGTQAHDLGVTLNPYWGVFDGTFGDQSGPVFAVPEATIPELLSAAAANGNLVQP